MPQHDRAAISQQFQLGRAAGLESDPNVTVADLRHPQPRHRTTGLRSRWLHRRCTVCGHSFRPGDAVLVYPDGTAVHDLPGLRCTEGTVTVPPAADTAGTADFFAGLTTAWPLPDEVPLTLLTPGHWLLAPPQRGHRRAACRVCGHTFRPQDRVVICPCDPTAPRCQAAVHRDLIKQLHCWDLWQGSPHHATSCLGMS